MVAAKLFLQNCPPAFTSPSISRISPSNKSALSRQRDHSACRRPDTPLKVRKTRENLKQCGIYTDIPPPCVHLSFQDDSFFKSSTGPNLDNLQRHDNGTELNSLSSKSTDQPAPHMPDSDRTAMQSPREMFKMQRQKSISRRVFSRVKQGIAGRSKASHTIRAVDSETTLARTVSGRIKQSCDSERRAQSYEISRYSLESGVDATPEPVSLSTPFARHNGTTSTVSTAELFDHTSVSAPTRPHCYETARSTESDTGQAQKSIPPTFSSPSPLRTSTLR